MPTIDSTSNFWTTVTECRNAFWNGNLEAAQRHIAKAAQVAGHASDADTTNRQRKIALLEQLARLYKLDLTPPPAAADPVQAPAIDTITPDGLPGISIVTCSKNRTKNLIKALRTWLPHDQVSEIIIVDWCSDHPVRADLNAAAIHDPRIRVIRAENEPRWILSTAFNLGFRVARYDTILKADADIVLSPDFFERNTLLAKSFIAGNWRLADKGQAYVNGFFYASKAALAQVAGFNEHITTYGWDDDDLYDRLVLEGQSRVDVVANTVNHLDHSDDDRLGHQGIASSVGKTDTTTISARQELCETTMFLIRRNRMIAALMPYWGTRSTLMPVSILAQDDTDIQVQRGNWHPNHVPRHIVTSADFFALSELLSWRLGLRVRELDRDRLDRLLEKPLSEIAKLDVELALSNRPEVVGQARFCVLAVSDGLIESKGTRLPALLQGLADRVRAKGYCPALRLETARLPEKQRAEILQAYPCLEPWLDLGKLEKTDIECLGTSDMPRKATIRVDRKMAARLDAPAPDRKPEAAQVIVPRARMFIDAQHGLGNRMRAIGSAAAIAQATERELVIVWQSDSHCEGLFSDLFEYSGPVIEEAFVTQAAAKGCKVYNYMEVEEDAEKDAPLDLDWSGDIYARAAYVLRAAPSTWTAENRFLHSLTPVARVRELVDGVRTPNDLSAHVRMVGGSEYEHLAYESLDNWTEEGHAETDFWRRKSHFSHFIARIDALISEGRAARVFLAADKSETYEAFVQTFGDRVAYLPRALYDRSAEQLQYALADALLLGSAPLLLGSSWSSFSELAMRLSPQKMEIEMSGKDF